MYYNADGEPVQENLTGTLTAYYKDGSTEAEVPYQKGEVNGTYKLYYPQNKGIHIEAGVKGDVYDGEFKEYGENGRVIMETTYQDGKIVKNMKIYYDDGALLLDTPFVDGVRKGTAIGYYENGKKAFTIPYDKDQISGLLTIYYPNGKPKTEKRYLNDKWTEDEYREYNDSGKLTYEIANDGYGTKYYKVDADGTKTELDNVEKYNLLERIDTSYLDKMSEEELLKFMEEKRAATE